MLTVIDILPHCPAQTFGVLGPAPLETRDAAVDGNGRERVAWIAGLGEQIAHQLHRMTHHVVEHTAALHVAAPEPWHVRATVFFGCAREIRASGSRCAATPDQRPAGLDLRREQLILQIAVHQSNALDELEDRCGFRDVACEWLFARDCLESAPATLDRADYLPDVLDAGEVGAEQPDRVDRGIGNHVGDGIVRAGISNIERARERRGRGCVLTVRTPDSEYVRVAHSDERLEVEPGDETAANEADAESVAAH